MTQIPLAPMGAVLLWAASAMAAAQPAPAPGDPPTAAETPNDGTDPTRPIRQLRFAVERLELRGDTVSTEFLTSFTQPLSRGRQTVRLAVPLVALDAPGVDRFGLGDIGVQYANVFHVRPTHGWVAQIEVEADSASRDALGTGKWVAKPTLIYARFLKGGHILAPSLLHNISFAGDPGRARVNLMTFDLYFVPKLPNPFFMTVDPAANVDWANDRQYGALAVTMGHNPGPALGGMAQMSLKPSVGVGG